MSAKIKYTNEPMGSPKVIRDFLSSSEQLAFRDEDVKITITLSKKSRYAAAGGLNQVLNTPSLLEAEAVPPMT